MSNIDRETDATVQQLSKEKRADRTVLTVAHRMDTILSSDIVIILKYGAIVEFGSLTELCNVEGALQDLRKFREVSRRIDIRGRVRSSSSLISARLPGRVAPKS